MNEEKENSEDVIDLLTPEEKMSLAEHLQGGFVSPSPQEQHNVHKFLHDVSLSEDTTKTGFLSDEELGTPNLPTRSLKELALFCDNIWKQEKFAEFFQKQSEIVTSTSLSRDAKLLELAVVTRRELADLTKPKKTENKGWFKKKSEREVN